TLIFSSGAATTTITPYKAETGVHLSIVDTGGTGVMADSGNFDVNPGPLATFKWSYLAAQTAGVAFHPTATAYDAYGNVKTNYAGASASISHNLEGSAGGWGGACTASAGFASASPHFTAGIATVNATGYKAEDTRFLTITDGSVSANTNNFTMKPGALFRFAWDGISDATAGVHFHPTVTAYDAYDNVKTNYVGTPSLTN